MMEFKISPNRFIVNVHVLAGREICLLNCTVGLIIDKEFRALS